MEVTIVGSGTLLPDGARGSPAHLVEGDRFRLLLDCGSGTVHGMARLGRPWRELTHVAISHFHTDHTGDLAALLWALKHGTGERRDPLTLLGPPGLSRVVRALAEAHGDFVLEPGFPLEVVELERSGRWLDGEAGLEIRTHPTPHTPESVAFRVHGAGVGLGYTGDTGPHPPLGAFFEGVDLLVAECAMSDERATDNHLSPGSVGALLRDARPRAVVLTHLYPMVGRESLPDLMRTLGFTGRVWLGRDGLRFHLGHDGYTAGHDGAGSTE